MNIRQLQYILEIAKEGSVTAAAANLFISQPSLSALLASVERDMGTKLFDRSVSPLALTLAGQKYVECAERILGAYNELRHDIDELRDPKTGFLNIGCGPQQSPFIIPVVLPVMGQRYPKARFNLVEEPKAVLEDRLVKGTLDVIICSEIKEYPNVDSIVLSDEEVSLMAPLGFGPARAKRLKRRQFPVIDLNEVADQPFVLMKRGHNLRSLQDTAFSEAGVNPRVILETDSWQTCLRLVEAAMAFTILPYSRMAPVDSPVRMLSLPQAHYRHTVIYHRRHTYYPELLREFIQVTRARLKI
ncbi:MAG: LysR family transcriptional regulator [Propionibacteriaceae bacterium]|jgi:DNA-binding transcriptional LysR family regulator|nr:LysR family transcriptional regulator [Propionibacteriaceae bacterium]